MSSIFSHFLKFFLDFFLLCADNQNMKDRLKQLRKSLGLTQREFGEKIGMGDTAISHMEAGTTAINNQNINLICLTFGTSKEWLRDGIGEMFNNKTQTTEQENRLLDLFRQLSPAAKEIFFEHVKKVADYEKSLRDKAKNE